MNRDKILLRKKIYREKNRDAILIEKKNYYQKNKTIILEKSKKYKRDNFNKNKKRQSEYRKTERFKSRNREYIKNYYIKNKEQRNRYSREYYNKNKEKISISYKKYREKNKSKINKYMNLQNDTNVDFKIRKLLRSRLLSALKNKQKKGSAVRLLGCSIPEFIKYFEALFSDGMSWSNQGDWHIDHIKPLSIFDLAVPSQLEEACHHTNLQPLWAIDNIKKSNKYDIA